MLVLYGVNLSTFTRKVRLALVEKGLDYRLEVAAMGSARVRAMNPLGRIPVLGDEGFSIPDSSVAIAYLERRYPLPPLYPADAQALARALWLEEYADTRLREVTLPYFTENVVKPVFQGLACDPAVLEAAAGPRDTAFDYLESQLPDSGWALGAMLTVADLAIGAQLLTYRQGGGLVEASRWPRLERYLGTLAGRPPWRPILAEEQAALDAARARSRGAR